MADAAPDKRLTWLGTRVCNTLRIKDEAWKAILGGDSKYIPAVCPSRVAARVCRSACTNARSGCRRACLDHGADTDCTTVNFKWFCIDCLTLAGALRHWGAQATQARTVLQWSSEWCRKDVEAFLAKDVQTRLMIYAENGRDYVASAAPPGKYKKKAMFFVKTEPCVLTPENIAEKLTFGDVGEAPLETLSTIAENVYLPLLTSPNNQVGWPDVLSKEVSDSLHKFTANIFVTIGQCKGQTMLPLPAGACPT